MVTLLRMDPLNRAIIIACLAGFLLSFVFPDVYYFTVPYVIMLLTAIACLFLWLLFKIDPTYIVYTMFFGLISWMLTSYVITHLGYRL